MSHLTSAASKTRSNPGNSSKQYMAHNAGWISQHYKALLELIQVRFLPAENLNSKTHLLIIERQKEIILHKKNSTLLWMLMDLPNANYLFPYALVTCHLKNKSIRLKVVLHSRLCFILIDLTTKSQSIKYVGTLPMFHWTIRRSLPLITLSKVNSMLSVSSVLEVIQVKSNT